MISFRMPVGVAIILFSSLIWTAAAEEGDALNALLNREDGPPQALVFKAKSGDASKFGEMPLDGRSLIASWLDKRQRTCIDTGYSPCANTYGCCPTGDNCCTFGCCKSSQSCCRGGSCADQGDTCCSFGTCPSGWDCCGVGTCYPKGGECCSDGNYCEAGNHCYLVRGLHSCCTDSKCTAHVSNGVTTTAAGYGSSGNTRTIAPASITTTRGSDPTASVPVPPTPSTTVLTSGDTTRAPSSVTVGVYQYYYFTITWWYYSYYWTFYTFQSSTSTGSSYSQITTSTIVSIYETDSFSARSSFRSLSATFPTPTPVEATQLSTLPSQTKASAPSTQTGIGAIGTGASSSSTSSSQSAGKSVATKLQAGWGLSGSMAAFLLASLTSGILMLML